MIRLGYVGSNTLLPSSSRTFRIANYTEARMLETTFENLQALKQVLEWNLLHDITLFRITSNLVPYASSPINSGAWKSKFKEVFAEIGGFIKRHGFTVSLHPGQYTVLNSPNEKVYKAAVLDLDYHATVLELMHLGDEAKIVLHCGGKYGNKQEAIETFAQRFKLLPTRMKSRIVLENDEKNCDAEDIYALCNSLNIPGVFDVFHQEVLPSFTGLSDREIILKFKGTWKSSRQKIHYSNQDPKKPKGAHSATIDVQEFASFYEGINDLDLDIMLEVKDKQNSVLKLRQVFPKLK